MTEMASARTTGNGGRVIAAPTGRVETIAGYECEHVIVSSATVNEDLCLAKGIGTFLMAVGPVQESASASATSPALRELLAHGFPLLDRRVDGGLVLEVTKIDAKPLSDDLFRVPAGYAKLELRASTATRRGTK
jgi:hypothetical protein